MMPDVGVTIPEQLADLTPTELEALRRQVDEALAEILEVRARLQVMTTAPEQIEKIAIEFLGARDGTPPAEGSTVTDWPSYHQPLGAHDAYPRGYVVRWEDGRLYRTRVGNVVHTPDAAPQVWEDVTDGLVETPPPAGPAWVQPTGAHDAYAVGDLVTHDGQLWRSTVGANVWAPGVHGWELVA